MAVQDKRDYIVNGECLVKVKGNGALALSGVVTNGQLHELGLAAEAITVTPRFYHSDIKVDDFGPNCPAEVQWLLAECNIRMTLVHYDLHVLRACVAESMGGGAIAAGTEGKMQPAGTVMGGFKVPYQSGFHYIGLNLMSPVLEFPWRFPTAYLAEPPLIMPLGTEKSLAQLNWRAIPYGTPVTTIIEESEAGDRITEGVPIEIISSGRVLWDHGTFT